jgi:hypothetical protein
MLPTPSDMKTLKYNNLTNLTGMIWHIDPATKILETNQFWKLAFRIIETFKSRKWQICLPERSKGSIGAPTILIRSFTPWPSKSHEKHQLLLLVLANIQYSALGNLLNRHGNLHFLLYVPANIQYSAFHENHTNWKYHQKTIHLQIWKSLKYLRFFNDFSDLGSPKVTSQNLLFRHDFLEKYVLVQTQNLRFSHVLRGIHLPDSQKPHSGKQWKSKQNPNARVNSHRNRSIFAFLLPHV